MNVKKTLQNLIHGWLPKEANPPKAPTKISSNISHDAAVMNIEAGAIRVTHLSAIFVFIWVILVGFSVGQINSISNFSAMFFVCLIVGGSMLGLVLSAVFTKIQFTQVNKYGKYSMNLKDLVLYSVVFGSILVFAEWLVCGSSASLDEWFMLTSICIVSFFSVMYVRFFTYEKRKKVFMIGYWFKFDCFAVSRTSISKVKQKPLLDLSLGSKSGARTITFLSLLLILSLLVSCYYVQLIGVDIFLLSLVIVVFASVLSSIAITCRFKEKNAVGPKNG